jgi:hypothetical protein
VRPAAAGAVGFVLTVVFSGGGAIVVDVVVARGPVGTAAGATSSPYQSFTPLRPRHAPFFSALEEYVPSLHIPIVPVGAPAGGAAKTLADAMSPRSRAEAMGVFTGGSLSHCGGGDPG